jgi:hypothetical protein
VALAAIVVGHSQARAHACGAGLDGARIAESGGYIVAYRPLPAKIEVGRHFALELAVCAKDSSASIESVHVDGFMPEHGHGMNYRATVKPLAAGRYRAEGLMFHMPGRWDFIFDVRARGKTERLKHSFELQ